MFRKLKMKTLATFMVISLVAPTAFAQRAQPPEADDLPALRTTAPIRTGLDRGPSKRNSSSDDVAKVEVKKCTKRTGTFNWNWDNAKLSDIVTSISNITCKNFIISKTASLNGTITIISKTPVNADQAWQSFLSALESNNMAIVQAGSYNKIVTNLEAGKKNIPVLDKNQTIPGDEGMVTMIYSARNIPQLQAQQLITALSKTAPITAGEHLVFSDSALSVKRVLAVLEKVDVAGAANRIHIIDLEYSSAKDMLSKINEVYPPATGNRTPNFQRIPRFGVGGPEPEPEGGSQKVVADERTNKLIVIASDRMFVNIKDLVDKLDVQASGSSAHAQIHVYQLKNSKAKDLATTLQTLTQATANRAAQNRTPGTPFSPAAAAASVGEGQFEGEIKVTSDEKTNAILVSASTRDYRLLAQVIAKLDKRRPQVYVEAVIMEITAKDTQDWGLDFYSGFPLPTFPGTSSTYGFAGNAGGAQGSNSLAANAFKPFGANSSNPGQASALSLSNFISTFGAFGMSAIPGFANGALLPTTGVALKLLEQFTNVEILATPTLTTVDNETSSIEVGQRIPLLVGITSVAGVSNALGSVTSNVSYEDVTNKLKITPHVNDDDEILFEIEQEIKDLGQKISLGGNDQYFINKKKTETKVMTKDQQAVVIGGLISRKKSHIETKTPWLGDLPIIGYLFKDTKDEIDNSNLLLVLTPYVIRSQADNLKIYERKKKEHEDFGKFYFGDKILKFDPYIDYDKKAGPVAKMLHEVSQEMQKVENGGPGLEGEIIVKSDGVYKHKDDKLDAILPSIPVTPGADDGQTGFPVPFQQFPVPQEIPAGAEPGQAQPVPGAAPAVPAEQSGAPAGWFDNPPAANVPPPAGAGATGNGIVPQGGQVQAPPSAPPQQ
jgi:general secretion pathway protein D